MMALVKQNLYNYYYYYVWTYLEPVLTEYDSCQDVYHVRWPIFSNFLNVFKVHREVVINKDFMRRLAVQIRECTDDSAKYVYTRSEEMNYGLKKKSHIYSCISYLDMLDVLCITSRHDNEL